MAWNQGRRPAGSATYDAPQIQYVQNLLIAIAEWTTQTIAVRLDCHSEDLRCTRRSLPQPR
jgi:hypothetical protein